MWFFIDFPIDRLTQFLFNTFFFLLHTSSDEILFTSFCVCLFFRLFLFHENSCEIRYTFYRNAIDFLLKISTFVETCRNFFSIYFLYQLTSSLELSDSMMPISLESTKNCILMFFFLAQIWINKYIISFIDFRGLRQMALTDRMNSHSFFWKPFKVHKIR